MKRVWKYPVSLGGGAEVQMPQASRVVHFARQGTSLAFWAEVDDANPYERRVYGIYGTGYPIPAQADYCATLLDGEYVWHLYEVTRV